jgi:release factor glutamine methyltransferase
MSLVYQPAEDSYLILSVIKKYSKNKSVLDMCTGSGILAIEASKYSKSTTAADINQEAIINLKLNYPKIKSIKSNLFKNVKSKFDLIICNPPYLPLDKNEDKESRLATTGGKKGDEFTLKFVKEAVNHLNKNGIILLLLSSLTPRSRINNFLEKIHLKSNLIASKKVFFETLEVLEISNKSQ